MRYPYTVNISATARPTLAFVAVPGTRMDQIASLIGPQYKERGTTGLASTFDAWTSCALRGNDLIWIAPGGHNDSTFNGGIAYNSQSKAWRLLFQPSDYTDPVWEESRQLYIAAGLNPDVYNVTRPFAPGGDLVWKDGKQCSQHCWGLIVGAEEFGVFHLRSGSWRYDPTTWQGTKLPSVGSFSAPSDSYAWYVPEKKKIYVGVDNSPMNRYGQIFEVDPTSGAWTPVMENGQWQWYEAEACQMEDGRVFRFSRISNTAAVIDFAARTVTNTPTLSDLFAADPLIVLMQSNKTGVLALRLSGNLSSINVATGQVTDLGPSGIPPVLLSGKVRTNHTWNRLKLVTNGTAQKFVFPIATNADVYEMAI